ncbi:hypothetical protein KAI12_03690 [Candidatus Bathyarchaeota archaeon]|nr:hypothetical protein [Candidatus Bathyarchaeota archaeon]
MNGEYASPIYYALEKAQLEKGLRKLRFAKCSQCGRVTPYRLKSLKLNFVRCKACGNLIYTPKIVTSK